MIDAFENWWADDNFWESYPKESARLAWEGSQKAAIEEILSFIDQHETIVIKGSCGVSVGFYKSDIIGYLKVKLSQTDSANTPK